MTEPVPRLIRPDWPLPESVGAVATTRIGGTSVEPWNSLNLATHVEDDPGAVVANRNRFIRALGESVTPVWLQQVHGQAVVELDTGTGIPRGDAAFTRQTGMGCVILTADCLPVLLADRAGSVVAAAHAGWRGLSEGILRNTVEAMGAAPQNLVAWLGPAISQRYFEVGDEVLQCFQDNAIDPAHARALSAGFRKRTDKPGHHDADLYTLARSELQALGISSIHGGGFCTYGDKSRFYSYRRDGKTGRMATMVWLRG